MEVISSQKFAEAETRFVLDGKQAVDGVGPKGISEDFPVLPHSRTLYGATKLASGILLLEYIDMFGIRAECIVIDRSHCLGGSYDPYEYCIVLFVYDDIAGEEQAYIPFSRDRFVSQFRIAGAEYCISGKVNTQLLPELVLDVNGRQYAKAFFF